MLDNNKLLLCTSSGGGGSLVDGQVVTAPSGRRYARHGSGQGSVMFYNDGQDRMALVLDAKFRCYLGNACKQSADNTKYKYGFWINGSKSALSASDNGTTTNACQNITDAMLVAYDNILDAYTADYNTSLIESTSDAARHCRGISINDKKCAIPNIRILSRIYCDASTIDSMDKTLGDFPQNRLTGWPCAGGGIGDVRYAWTCVNTEDKCHGPYAVYQNGCCNFVYGFYGYPSDKAFVIPILELAA